MIALLFAPFAKTQPRYDERCAENFSVSDADLVLEAYAREAGKRMVQRLGTVAELAARKVDA